MQGMSAGRGFMIQFVVTSKNTRKWGGTHQENLEKERFNVVFSEENVAASSAAPASCCVLSDDHVPDVVEGIQDVRLSVRTDGSSRCKYGSKDNKD